MDKTFQQQSGKTNIDKKKKHMFVIANNNIAIAMTQSKRSVDIMDKTFLN